MAKAKPEDSTENTATDSTEATATAPAAPKMPSIGTRTKYALLAVWDQLTEDAKANEIELSGYFTDQGIYEEFQTLVSEIKDNQQRNLPNSVKLENVEKEITEHYATLPVVNGKAAVTPEWEAKQKALFTKRDNIKRAIRRESEEKAATASA